MMTTSLATRPPLLPLHLPNSPLLLDIFSDDLFSTFISQGISKPLPSLSFAPSTPTTTTPITPSKAHLPKYLLPNAARHPNNKPLPPIIIPPLQIVSVLDLLEQMDNDFVGEVQRVKLGIREARALVSDYKGELKERREYVAKRRAKEKRETKGVDDEFWLV